MRHGRYVGTNPRRRGLGLTAIVRPHLTQPGLVMVQLDDKDRWVAEMEATGRSWLPFKRTSWRETPDLFEEDIHGQPTRLH